MDAERDQHGRFRPGWCGGPGRPLGEVTQRLREAATRAVPACQVRRVMKRLLEMALDGDIQAARTLLHYLLGPPVPTDVIERIERLETSLGLSKQVNSNRNSDSDPQRHLFR